MRTVRQLQPLSERQVSTAKVFIRYGKFNLIFLKKKNYVCSVSILFYQIMSVIWAISLAFSY